MRDYIEVKIKKLFLGSASIRDYVYEKARREQKDILIVYQNDMMRVPHERLHEVKLSKRLFISKYTGEQYRLADFKWKPGIQQQTFL